MSRWDDLSMGDRAALISLFIKEGVSDPKVMRRLYDEGGDTSDIKPAVADASYPREREVLDLVNNSKADFVSRLADGNRATIPDWNNKDEIATHKLSYARDGDRWIIYPNVQNIDGKLYDFSDPKYGLDKGWQALDSALYAGDYVEVPSEADARWFTESYKRHYPGFNKYDGKTEKSQKMVMLGKDDYLVPEELKPSVITSDSNKDKITIPIDYIFPERDDVGYKLDIMRDVMQSIVYRDKKVKSNPLETLKGCNSAYRNPFIENPYYRNYINYGYNRFDDGGGANEVFDVIEPSFIVAERKPMTKRQIRKGSRVVRNILGNLGENGSYTPLQKKRMAEYIIRAQGGLPNPSIPRIIEMRKGLKYKNKDGVSGLERVLYGNEKIKDIIDNINSDHISYDDDGTSVVHGFSMYNYNGSLMDKDERYDNDIVDAYINGVAPYGGKEYVSQYNLGPYKNYIDKYYKGKDIKSYMFGESELPQDTIDRIDRYSYERGDNSFVVGANTDKNVKFRLRGNNDIPDGVYFDAAGHLWQFIKDDDGKFYVRQSDSYDFEPNQYRETYGDAPYIIDALSALESAGNPVLVFNPWKEADDLDLSELTKGKVLVDDVDEDAIKKAIECNKQRKNGKFLNAIDNALTLMYSVTR